MRNPRRLPLVGTVVKRWRVLLGGGALAVAAVVGAVLLPGGARVADPADSWSTSPAPTGQAVAALSVPEGERCAQSATSVAARGQQAWVGFTCSPPAGDESAPVPRPGEAVDGLRADGSVERLELPASGDVTVEDVGPDGTLWALSRGAVVKRSPGGAWQPVAGTADDSVLGDVVALDVTADGSAYLLQAYELVVVPPDGPPRTLLSDPRRAVTTSTYYVDEADRGPRPAASTPLPTLTGLTVLDDGTVVLLATDSVLTLDRRGALRTLVSPRTSGTDPATRLFRSVVRDGGSGSYLAAALPYGDGVLVLDQAAGRVLHVDREGEVERVAGRPANRVGGPADVAAALAPLDGQVGLDEVHLGFGGTAGRAVRMALLDDGQLLVSSPRQGVLRLGLPRR